MTVVAPARVSARDALGTLGLWIAGAAVLGTAGYLGMAIVTSDAEAPTLAAVFLAYATLPVAALIVYRPRGLRDRLAVRPVNARAYLIGVLVWLIALAVSAVIYLLLGIGSGDVLGPALAVVREATDYSRFAGATPLDWALIVPRALLLAGITEELLFRGILFGWLRPHLSWWPTALITVAIFAAIHGYYPVVVPVAFVLGVALAWLREHTGSVLPGILVHILTDSLLFAIALTLH